MWVAFAVSKLIDVLRCSLTLIYNSLFLSDFFYASCIRVFTTLGDKEFVRHISSLLNINNACVNTDPTVCVRLLGVFARCSHNGDDSLIEDCFHFSIHHIIQISFSRTSISLYP